MSWILKYLPGGDGDENEEWCQLLEDDYIIGTLSKAREVAKTTLSGLHFVLVGFPKSHYQFQETQTWKIPTTFMFLCMNVLLRQNCLTSCVEPWLWNQHREGKGVLSLQMLWVRVKGSDLGHSWDWVERAGQVMLLFPLSASYVPIEGVCGPPKLHWEDRGCSCVRNVSKIIMWFLKIFYFIIYLCICMYVCLYIHSGLCRGHKETSDALELEL